MTRREYLVGVTCSLDVPRSHFIIYKSNLGTRGRKAFDDEIHDLITSELRLQNEPRLVTVTQIYL